MLEATNVISGRRNLWMWGGVESDKRVAEFRFSSKRARFDEKGGLWRCALNLTKSTHTSD